MDSGVDGEFWAEAIATSAYLKSRSPTKGLFIYLIKVRCMTEMIWTKASKSVTPYEAWTK